MLNPFSFLKQKLSPSFLGIDIGTTSIKAVEVKQGKQLPQIVNYGILESQSSLSRANTVFQTSSLKLFDKEMVNLLTNLMATMKPGTTEVIASLPGFSAFMTIIDFPAMSPADLTKALMYKAKEYIPLPLSEVALDWFTIGSYEDEKGTGHMQVLLISVPQEQIRKYQNIFKQAGLSLRALEIEGLSVVRSTIAGDPTPTIIVDIGSRMTSIAMSEGGVLTFTAQTDFAGTSLTQALAKSLNINPVRAEELKRERGMAGTGPDYELSTIMAPFLDAIINEVKRAERTYMAQRPSAKQFERIIIAGGGATMRGIENYMNKQFSVPVVKAAPLSRFEYPPALEPLIGDLNPLMSVATGLALRELL